jgi:hypothetical protein
MNGTERFEQFHAVDIHRGWIVAARLMPDRNYEAIVIDPWQIEVGNSARKYPNTEVAIQQGKAWIDRYLDEPETNGLNSNFNPT